MDGLDRTRAVPRAVHVLLPLFAMCLACAPGAALDRPGPLVVCAAYDLHVSTLIEARGEEDDSDVAEIVAASRALIAARVACREGRIEQAIELYEDATLDRPERVMAHLRSRRP